MKEKHQDKQNKHDIHQQQNIAQCLVASLHILLACCLHKPFVIRYASRDSLSRLLAQIEEEEVALSLNDNGSRRNRLAEVIVVVLGLLVWLIVNWELGELVRFFAPKKLEDGSVDKGNAIDKTTSS